MPWDEVALQKAKREDKPILVSIGYSACHWCHVMAHESFENEQVASIMNKYFVNIKVDREERPDLDHLYMEAIQLISGSGGWPLNCFLTPDGRPFYGGTYFPPEPRYQRPSWSQVLLHIANLWTEKRSQVEEQADRLTKAIMSNQCRPFTPSQTVLPLENTSDKATVQHIYGKIFQEADFVNGGFGGAPKFPMVNQLRILLDYSLYSNTPEGIQHVMNSLLSMIRGGIYDQIGGGFARYTVDEGWQVPHFEKMLYDNAMLIHLMSDCCRTEAHPEIIRTIQQTIDYIAREMAHPEGGFYSALDADSEGEEGKFYVWSADEFNKVVDDEALKAYFGISAQGNWEGTNILHRPFSDSRFIEAFGLEEGTFTRDRRNAIEALMKVRNERVYPGLDEKVILGWNALMITGLLAAYMQSGNKEWKDMADRCVAFIESRLRRPQGGYYRIYAGNDAYQEAFLEDYAIYLNARLFRLQIQWEEESYHDIMSLLDWVIVHFFDHEVGAFKLSIASGIQGKLFDSADGALPSGNGMMVNNLHLAYQISGKSNYINIAQGILSSIRAQTLRFPGSYGQFALAVLNQAYGNREIIVVGPAYRNLMDSLQKKYIPGTLILGNNEPSDAIIFAGRHSTEKTLIYLCQDGKCLSPVDNVESLMQLL